MCRLQITEKIGSALDDFRNWVCLGFQPEKRNENR
jgi:hypothetical protein